MGPKLATEPDLKLHVTDADSSPSAVRIMKRRHAGLDNYTCHQTDVLNLPFPEESFDAVVDKGTLDALLCRNVEDAQGMATEMHRVLAKGGVFVQVRCGGGWEGTHVMHGRSRMTRLSHPYNGGAEHVPDSVLLHYNCTLRFSMWV